MAEIQSPACSDGPIWDVWLAAFHAPTLAVADEIGLFATLAEKPLQVDEVANALMIEVRAAEALLGLMCSLRFVLRTDGQYGLTEVARTYLLPTSVYYWGGFLRRIRNIPLDCNKLISGLKRGKAVEEARVSAELWRAPQPPPEALASFTHAMHAHSFSLAMRVVSTLGISGVRSFLDVAGGSGSYSIAAAIRDPSIRCTVLDLPVVCEITRDYARKLGVGDRVTAVEGDMFSDVWPTGFDRVFMSDIFHDWDDERCRLLAKRAYDALPSGGRILIHEMLLADSKDGPLAAAAYSMVMVFVAEGRQRSAGEIKDILVGAGFVSFRATPTAEGYAVLEATKP